MLTENYDIREVGAPISAANNTDSNSDRIDMSGYEGIAFIVPVTDSVATAVAHLKIEENTIDSDSGMTLITGADATVTCVVTDDLNNKLLVTEVFRPLKRYVQAVRTSGTDNIAFGNVIAILYKKRVLPPAEDASILDLAAVVGS